MVWLLVICVVVKDRLFWVCCCGVIAVFGFLVVWWPDCLLWLLVVSACLRACGDMLVVC